MEEVPKNQQRVFLPSRKKRNTQIKSRVSLALPLMAKLASIG
jgi:hypothetical protein